MENKGTPPLAGGSHEFPSGVPEPVDGASDTDVSEEENPLHSGMRRNSIISRAGHQDRVAERLNTTNERPDPRLTTPGQRGLS